MGGFNYSDSDSESKPLTAQERRELYLGNLQNLSQTMPGYFNYTAADESAKPSVTDFTTYDPYGGGEGTGASITDWDAYNSALKDWELSGSYTFNAPEYQEVKTQTGLDTATLRNMLGDGYKSPDYVTPEKYAGDAVASSAQGTSAVAGQAEATRLSDGDYARLEQSLYDSAARGIDDAVSKRNEDINQEMSDRGIWASGMPIQQQAKEYEETFAPLYLQAADNATAQRYNLESSENKGVNQLAGQNAGFQTQASIASAGNKTSAGLQNAQLATQTSLANQQARNNYNMQTANSANQFNLANAERAGQSQTQQVGLLSQNAMQNAQMQNQGGFQNEQNRYQSQWAPLNYLSQLYGGTGGQTSQSDSTGFGMQVSYGSK